MQTSRTSATRPRSAPAARIASSIPSRDFDDALERVVAGLLSHRAITENEKRIIAYHEAGHALMSHLLGMPPVHKVTIIPRGTALGYAWSLPDEERFLVTREELCDEMTMSLSGRVSEILVFGRMSSGAMSDLEQVSKIARWMVCELGMGSIVESRTLLAADQSLSEETKRLRDAEQERLTNAAFEEAMRLLSLHREALDLLAEHLLEHESLDRTAARWSCYPTSSPSASHSDEVGRVMGVAASRDTRREPSELARLESRPVRGVSPVGVGAGCVRLGLLVLDRRACRADALRGRGEIGRHRERCPASYSVKAAFPNDASASSSSASSFLSCSFSCWPCATSLPCSMASAAFSFTLSKKPMPGTPQRDRLGRPLWHDARRGRP